MGACESPTKSSHTHRSSIKTINRSYTCKYYNNLFSDDKKQIVQEEKSLNNSIKVEIFISILNLPVYNVDAFKIIVYLDNNLIGETEIRDGSEIHYSKSFPIVYTFENQQNLKFEIVPTSKTNKHYEQVIDIQNLMRSKTRILEQEILYGNTNDNFKLVIIADQYSARTRDPLQMFKFSDIVIIGLQNAERMKVFFEFHNFKDKVYWRPMYQSETVVNVICPKFNEFIVSKDDVCSNDFSKEIKFSVFDHDYSLLGEAKTSIEKLLNYSLTPILDCENNKLGQIQVKFNEFNDISYYELMNSLKFYSVIAIDFTESNGLQTDEKSLHFIKTKNEESILKYLNPYQSALNDLERLLIYFNSSTVIPFFGFGGVCPGGNNKVNFCFDLYSFYPSIENIVGVQGVLTVYNKVINIFKFSAPTFLSPFFEHLLKTFFHILNYNPYNYYIVWILLDGDIDDFQQTEKVLSEAFNYGITVIICGIGDAKFGLMNDFIKSINSSPRPLAYFFKIKEYENKVELLADKIRNSIFIDVKKYFILRKLSTFRMSQLF